ncbi:leucine-rich repeat domain-containing protein, partial [Leptospira interrogans]|nr:leucine-rich repeat domain-containing protein [Leptospira interrogans]
QLTMLPKQIAALKQLARLSLKGNQFPSEEKERIQRLLPKCNISF